MVRSVGPDVAGNPPSTSCSAPRFRVLRQLARLHDFEGDRPRRFSTGRPRASRRQHAGHGQKPGLTGVFLHEFAHTRQIPGLAHIIGPIDSAWKSPPELDDDAVQKRFGSGSTYAASYLVERDLVYCAAAAESLADVRALATQALAMIRSRHARWFTGEKAVFATLDDT